jgi:hypothetical protein
LNTNKQSQKHKTWTKHSIIWWKQPKRKICAENYDLKLFFCVYIFSVKNQTSIESSKRLASTQEFSIDGGDLTDSSKFMNFLPQLLSQNKHFSLKIVEREYYLQHHQPSTSTILNNTDQSKSSPTPRSERNSRRTVLQSKSNQSIKTRKIETESFKRTPKRKNLKLKKIDKPAKKPRRNVKNAQTKPEQEVAIDLEVECLDDDLFFQNVPPCRMVPFSS